MPRRRPFPRAAEALRAPAKVVISKSRAIVGGPWQTPRPSTSLRPHLERSSDGAIVLVEDRRRRFVHPDAARALECALGPVRGLEGVRTRAPVNNSRAVERVGTAGVRALALCTPARSSIAIANAAERSDFGDIGRAVRPLAVSPAARGGADPDRGDGALDRLSRARAHGATHLMVMNEGDWLGQHTRLADHLARAATIVACNATATLWELPPRAEVGEPKVFVIGLPKTGTTSLHTAFKLLGLRSFHWGGSRAYHAVLQSQRQGERLLHDVGERFDAYSDVETLSVRFDLADLQYPGSRFIFTVRDVDDWIASRRRHAERNELGHRDGTYAGRNLGIDEETWRSHWEAQQERVAEWFRGRDDLLVLDVCAGDGWEKVAPFLDRTVPRVPFPRENVDGIVSRRFAWWQRQSR